MERLPKLAEEFLTKLQLNWPVVVEERKGDMLLIRTELIDVKERKGRHIISAPKSYLQNPIFYRVDWAHELCHALLAERIDPIFGGSPVVGEMEPRELERRAQILFFATRHEDLLVNDARDEILGRELTLEDCQSFQQGLISLIKQSRTNYQARISLSDPRMHWQIALNIAEDERHCLELMAEEVMKFFDDDIQQQIRKILKIYRQLPLLSWERERVLADFEKSVQRIAQDVLQVDFLPKIVEHFSFPGRKVWSVE